MAQVGLISLSADCCSCYLPEFQMSSSNYMIFQITFCCQRRCSCVSSVTICSPHTVFWVLFLFSIFWFGALFVFCLFLWFGFFFFFFFFFFGWESFSWSSWKKLFTPLQLALSTHESEQSFRYFAIPYAKLTNI